jgi:hypothetical protein
MPAAGDGSYSYEVAQSCNTSNLNQGVLTFSQVSTNASTTLAINLYLEGDLVDTYAFPANTTTGAHSFENLVNGLYSYEVTPSPGTMVGDSVNISCAPVEPDPVLGCMDPAATNYNPAATEDNGTCVYPVPGCTDPLALNYNPAATANDGTCVYPNPVTPPAAKYMAVGGTLSNPIEYTFAFQVNDMAAVPKTGHYVTVNIYREGELTPFASTRQRIRNGAAVVDVARFVKALVSSQPAFNDSIVVTVDVNAIAGFTIGFVEAWGTTTLAEVKENTVKYAVNAALQSISGNYVQHVIQAAI